MITNGAPHRSPAIGKKINFLSRAKWLFGLAMAAMLSVAATAPPISTQNLDEQYIEIMNLIDHADALREVGKTAAAKAKYKQVEALLLNFKRANPQWNSKAVNYRLNEVTARLETRTISVPAPSTSKPAVNLESSSKSYSKSTVKLLDPGTEPRKILRLHPKAGDKQATLLTLKVNMDIPGMPAGAAPQIPPVTMPADVSIQKVDPNGDITFDVVLGEGGLGADSSLPPKAAENAKKGFATIKGLTFSMLMSSRGTGRVLDVTAPPGAPADMSQAIMKAKEAISTIHTSTPILALPEEAVGAGAKWQVTTVMTTNGMAVDQTSTFQLTSVDGDHISISKTVDFKLKGTPKSNGGPGTPMTMAMGAMDISGKFDTTSALDLSKLVPVQASWDGDVAMNMGMKTPKGNQPMSMKAKVNATLESH